MSPADGSCSGIPSKTDPSPTSDHVDHPRRPRPRRVAGDQVDLGHHRPPVAAARARAGGRRRACTGPASSGSRTADPGSRRCGSRRAGRTRRTRPAASPGCWPGRRRRCATRPGRRSGSASAAGCRRSTSYRRWLSTHSPDWSVACASQLMAPKVGEVRKALRPENPAA